MGMACCLLYARSLASRRQLAVGCAPQTT